MQLTDKVAIVTGSGRGIGRATAERLAEAGTKVVVADLNPDTAAAVAAGIANAGGTAIDVQVDVASEADAERLAQTARDHFGRIDVLVNNAGIGLYTPLLETTLEQWNQVLTVNLTALFLCSKYCIPVMKENKVGDCDEVEDCDEVGSIINIASVRAIATTARTTAYTATKGAVIGLTRAMATEFGDDGIRVNCVLPGAIDTDMMRENLAEDGLTLADATARVQQNTPLRRLGAGRDIANMIAFLSSADASYITGASFVVDGGRTIQL
ncbi:MAG: glucose 1-dehydrogenase [Chloroflexi bacterium]|nr:glucose 1-dehydrogenase [Chloroflexota bacterium]